LETRFQDGNLQPRDPSSPIFSKLVAVVRSTNRNCVHEIQRPQEGPAISSNFRTSEIQKLNWPCAPARRPSTNIIGNSYFPASSKCSKVFGKAAKPPAGPLIKKQVIQSQTKTRRGTGREYGGKPSSPHPEGGFVVVLAEDISNSAQGLEICPKKP